MFTRGALLSNREHDQYAPASRAAMLPGAAQVAVDTCTSVTEAACWTGGRTPSRYPTAAAVRPHKHTCICRISCLKPSRRRAGQVAPGSRILAPKVLLRYDRSSPPQKFLPAALMMA